MTNRLRTYESDTPRFDSLSEERRQKLLNAIHIQALKEALDREEREIILELNDDNVSWHTIAEPMRISRQAAWEHYTKKK